MKGATRRRERSGPVETHVPQPRRAAFDWAEVPVHWVPDDPSTTHVINALHLLFPAGERWFVRTFNEALPQVDDDVLHQQVRAFMSQEGQHATAHDSARAHLEAHGIDAGRYLARLRWLFDEVLSARDLPDPLARQWLATRLGIIAGVEHYTAVLGQWILDQDALEAAGADPTMLDLLRWHGAEEVEHRSVAFDLYQHVAGGAVLRVTTAAVAFTGLLLLAAEGTRALLAADPTSGGGGFLRAYLRGQSRGRLPSLVGLSLAGLRYLRPGFHPSQEGDLRAALDYVRRSPSHLRAAAVVAARRGRRTART